MRIAIICENDIIWALPVWEKTIPILKSNGIEIKGFWCCEKKLSTITKNQVGFWYLKTFGLWNFTLLCLFIFANLTIDNKCLNCMLRVACGISVLTIRWQKI